MSRKSVLQFTICLFVAGILLSSCAGSQRIMFLEPTKPLPTPMPTHPTIQPTEQKIQPVKQTEVAILATEVQKSPEPDVFDQSGPWFSPLISFAVEPDRKIARQMFPSGVKQIYAMWEYGNMHSGLTMRREWYRDGELWLEREEMWDMDKYGSNGIVSDISVYDFDNGLEAGSYLLKLFIDGQEFRSDGYMSQTFVVKSFEVIEPVYSSDGQKIVSVDASGTLRVQSADGSQQTVLKVPGVTSLAWHPDGVHIFYSMHSSSTIPPTPHGFWHELWVIDTQTGEQWLLAGAEEDLHQPVVSPTGPYLALISGSGFADACFVDKRLVILQLDSELKREAVFALSEFSGIEWDLADTGMLVSVYPVGDPFWRSNSLLEVELGWTCTTDSPGGVYQLELEGQRAGKME